MCDPYMHCEQQLGLTRRCLEIIDQYGFGLSIQTKSDRVLRDLDLLKSINEKSKCVVQMTLTTYDENLCKILEPNVCSTKYRFEVLKILRDNKIPSVVWLSPLLPYINDTEDNLRGILEYCVEAKVFGIICFGIGMTLREGDREYFYAALDRSFPGLRAKYQSKYGYAYEVMSENSEALMRIFQSECNKHGIMKGNERIFAYLHEFPEQPKPEQLSLF
ncbi:hypothetical protein SDC9_177941 [bioreactor metagenome]|uniref:Radical SAM core domain-containing protein n=1 Tax=bioreactor metagenome TaxID=1076179 RepID=A0A645GVU3_9ZZZZ